jgi:hypothetical protein
LEGLNVRPAFGEAKRPDCPAKVDASGAYAINGVFARQPQARPSKEMTPAKKVCDAGHCVKNQPVNSSPTHSTPKDISGRYLQTTSDDGIAENVGDFAPNSEANDWYVRTSHSLFQSAPEVTEKRSNEFSEILTRVDRRLRQPMPPMMRRGPRPIS